MTLVNASRKPVTYVVAIYLDSGQQAVEDADSQCKGLRTEVEHPAHLSQPKDHFLVLQRRDVCALRGQNK